MNPVPNPGSQEAWDAGCNCPILDNSYGRGYMGQEGVFVYTVGCKVHTQPQPTATHVPEDDPTQDHVIDEEPGE